MAHKARTKEGTARQQPSPRLRKFLASLPPLYDILRGSLLKRHTFHPASVSCSTCAKGKGHRQWVLNVNYPGGKTRQVSLHPSQVPQVRRQLDNLDRLRRILEQICEVNQQQLPEERAQLRSQDHD
jgi:hypothetical protein